MKVIKRAEFVMALFGLNCEEATSIRGEYKMMSRYRRVGERGDIDIKSFSDPIQDPVLLVKKIYEFSGSALPRNLERKKVDRREIGTREDSPPVGRI